MHQLAILLQFCRPHTVVATSVQALTLFLISGGAQSFDSALLLPVALVLASCLAVNVYIVGLNQLTDIAIDRINKPHLPLASGELSPEAARRITATAAVASLGLALAGGPILFATITTIFLIGTLYSLPPLRLKRFPLVAALSIALARGLLANVGVALHYQAVFGGTISTAAVIALGSFFFGFGIVIALYKDLPDTIGDRMYAIQTFATQLGPHRVLVLGRLVLTACYLLPIGLSLPNLPAPAAIFSLASHLLVIGLFWLVSSSVNLASHHEIRRFYMFLWSLFYAEFVLLSIGASMERVV